MMEGSYGSLYDGGVESYSSLYDGGIYSSLYDGGKL